MARLRDSWCISLSVDQQPRNPQSESIARTPYDAVRQEIAPHAFLDFLLETELSGREARRVKTSLKLSNLPTGQTLENFDFAFQPAIERSRIDTLATCACTARWLTAAQRQ